MDHFLPFKNVDAARSEDEPGAEHMRAHVVAIGPYAGMRIIDEVNRISQEVVEVVISRSRPMWWK